jgi:hypothetical protein
MGLSVASLGLIGIGNFFLRYAAVDPFVISGFAMGASSIALFARVGGGIYGTMQENTSSRAISVASHQWHIWQPWLAIPSAIHSRTRPGRQ